MPEQSFKVDGGIEAVGIITGTSFKRVGGSSTEFLMADGSVDNRTYTTTDTTYDIQARDSGVANRKHIRLSTVGGGNTDVTLVGGSNVSINRNNQELEISSSYTDTNTTYGVSAVSDGSNESIILTAGGSGSGISSVSFVPGSSISLSRSGNNITIGFGDENGDVLTNGDVRFNGTSGQYLEWDKSQSALEFQDEAKAKFGSGNDLKISHTNDVSGQNDSNGDSVLAGTDWCSLIHEDGTGPLIFKSDGGPSSGAFQFYDTGWRPILKLFSGTNARTALYHAGLEKLVTSEHGINVTGNVETDTFSVSGVTTFNQDVNFPGALYNIHWDQPTSKFKFDDNAQCVFGSATGGDLRIFHASGNSTIKNETGQFRLAGNDIRLQSQNNSKDYIICTDGSDVQLLYNDVTKFTTTNTGINVVGDIVASAHGSVGGALTVTGATTLTGNTIIGGDLTVNGTQTIINSNTLQVGDSQILLNKDETGTPSQNAGIQVERGTSPNVQIRWDENGNNWDFTNDGTTYYNIPLTNTTYSVSAVDGDPNKKKIRLTSAQDISPTSTTDDVTLAGGTGITLSRSADEITITNNAPHVDTFPSGGIIMWSGAEASIPSGWVLCNGNNSTPDLRNKFIVGAGSGGNYSVGNTGGADNVTLTTSQIPAHSHDAGTLDADNAGSHTHSYTYPSGTSTFDNDEDYSAYTGTSSGNTGSSGDHGHNISGDTGNRGGGGSHENRPPYYALCYIMKA